jgi:hypothetical protein
MDRKLFAGVNAILRISSSELNRRLMIKSAHTFRMRRHLGTIPRGYAGRLRRKYLLRAAEEGSRRLFLLAVAISTSSTPLGDRGSQIPNELPYKYGQFVHVNCHFNSPLRLNFLNLDAVMH